MAKTRALLTETEREQLAGEHGDRRKYQATSRARRRIHEELTTDVALLERHHPDLLDELREVVCADATPAKTDRQAGHSGGSESDDYNTEQGDNEDSVNQDTVYQSDNVVDDLRHDERQQKTNTDDDDDERGGDTA